MQTKPNITYFAAAWMGQRRMDGVNKLQYVTSNQIQNSWRAAWMGYANLVFKVFCSSFGNLNVIKTLRVTGM
jgi:hypothetical protein